MGEHQGGTHCSLNSSAWFKFAKDKVDSCWEKWQIKLHIRNSTPTPKPYPNSEEWWREHHGLGMLYCRRA